MRSMGYKLMTMYNPNPEVSNSTYRMFWESHLFAIKVTTAAYKVRCKRAKLVVLVQTDVPSANNVLHLVWNKHPSQKILDHLFYHGNLCASCVTIDVANTPFEAFVDHRCPFWHVNISKDKY